MKVYLGIIAVLTFIFFQVNKNYENNPSLSPFNKVISDSTEWFKINKDNYELLYKEDDTEMQKSIASNVDKGITNAESFFKKEFKEKFSIYIFPDRNELDKQWQNDWGMPEFKSECWMVASGVANRLDILSPTVWKEQACEHDAQNINELNKLIAHEIIHVFQGQYNPRPDFEGMDKIGWFVEGLAVYASGQFDNERIKRAKEALDKNVLPIKLENIWSGNYRYALAGSFVSFIDKKYGREIIIELIKCTTQVEILNILNCSEEELLVAWKNSIMPKI